MYTHHDELAVSGVGVADDDWGALGLDPPLDFNERFDTTSEPGTHIKVSRNDLEDGQHGYPFHEACWALLEKTWAPEPVPVRRLFDACLSLPWSGHAGNFTWDHDYGGVVFRRMGYSPWEDVHCVQDVPCGRADPYLSPEIQKLPHLTPTLEGAPQEGAIATRKGHDIFAHLPFEIVLHVATYLPTPDYLNARRALRALYPVFYTNHFWRSRFGPGGERDWIFEAPVWQVSCDWLSIYRRTQHGSPDMENRQRLWKLASILKGILSPQWMEPEEGDINTTSGMDMDSCVSEVTGNIEKASHQLLEGCRRFHQRQAPVSTDLSRIAFSVIRSCDVTYISGLRLIMASGRDIPLGYISDQEEVVDVATLTGLRVAAGSRGIRAIQCIAGEKTFPWIGCPDDVPMTERLIFEEPITGINAGFDVRLPMPSTPLRY